MNRSNLEVEPLALLSFSLNPSHTESSNLRTLWPSSSFTSNWAISPLFPSSRPAPRTSSFSAINTPHRYGLELLLVTWRFKQSERVQINANGVKVSDLGVRPWGGCVCNRSLFVVLQNWARDWHGGWALPHYCKPKLELFHTTSVNQYNITTIENIQIYRSSQN